jgi:hypothetical protein
MITNQAPIATRTAMPRFPLDCHEKSELLASFWVE